MSLYRDQYRVESTRLPGWDYAGRGWYFVTLCTHHRARLLCDIRDGCVCPSAIGRIVAEEWQRTPLVRPNVVLDVWVIMPDHLHGILRILPTMNDGPAVAESVPSPHLHPGSLGAIIGQFKSLCTKRIRAAAHRGFAWQPRYYDKITRDPDHLNRARWYIAANPMRWERDHAKPPGLFM